MSTAAHRDVSHLHAEPVMMQRSPTVHPTAAAVDGYPADFEVTDGGVLIHIGDATVDLTTGATEPDDIHANLIRAKALRWALFAETSSALGALDQEIGLIGERCEECEGTGGREMGSFSTHADEWDECPHCGGSGRITVAA